MWNEKVSNGYYFFFWILVTCGDGSTQKSCGECPKPTSDDDANCESANGDCVVKKFTTFLNPLTFENPSQEEFFCTSKYLNRINKIHNSFLLSLKVYIYVSQGRSKIWKSGGHSMATANLNKSVWLVTNTTTVSKYIPKRTESVSIEIPPSDPNLLGKSTSKYEYCETRFTS